MDNKCQNWRKVANLDLSDLEKGHLERFNREKVTDQFLRKLSKVQKGHKFGPFKNTLRAIQPNPSYDMLLMSSQRSLMPKKRKSY